MVPTGAGARFTVKVKAWEAIAPCEFFAVMVIVAVPACAAAMVNVPPDTVVVALLPSEECTV